MKIKYVGDMPIDLKQESGRFIAVVKGQTVPVTEKVGTSLLARVHKGKHEWVEDDTKPAKKKRKDGE